MTPLPQRPVEHTTAPSEGHVMDVVRQPMPPQPDPDVGQGIMGWRTQHRMPRGAWHFEGDVQFSPGLVYAEQFNSMLDLWNAQLSSIHHELRSGIAKIEELSEFVTTSAILQPTAINSIIIDGRDVILTRPLFIILEEYEDEKEITVRIPEFQAAGFGADELQAINELKIFLGELYEDLNSKSDETLGTLPTQWKLILRELVGSNA